MHDFGLQILVRNVNIAQKHVKCKNNVDQIADQVRCSHTAAAINQKRFLESVSGEINGEMVEQKKLTSEGELICLFYFTRFTPRDSERHEI